MTTSKPVSRTKLGVTLGFLLAVAAPASAHGTGGHQQGYGGPGPMMGRPGMMGPGTMMGPMMGQPGMMGPGMMMGPMMGQPGAMAPCPGMQHGQQADRDLSADDVRARLERWLAMQGNPRLTVGSFEEKDEDTIVADIVTKEGGVLVDRFEIDRHTGAMRRAG
jgi:hypothetical protein